MDARMLDTSACPGPLGVAAWRLQAGKLIGVALAWMIARAPAGRSRGVSAAMARRMDREEAARSLDARVLRDIGFFEEECGANNGEKER